jgi:hypothetical protein
MKKELTHKSAKSRNIVILVGRGKSILTNFFWNDDNVFSTTLSHISQRPQRLETTKTIVICGINNDFKNEWKVDEFLRLTKHFKIKTVIHVDGDELVDRVPKKIKARALVYKIGF